MQRETFFDEILRSKSVYLEEDRHNLIRLNETAAHSKFRAIH